MQHGLCIVYMLGARGALILSIWYFNRALVVSHIFFKWIRVVKHNNIQLLTGFEDNSSFVWHEDWSVARSCRLRTQICSRVKQKCCCPRSQSITVLLYTFILSKFSYSWSLFPLAYPLDVFKILVRQNQESGRRLNIVTLISCDLLKPSDKNREGRTVLESVNTTSFERFR